MADICEGGKDSLIVPPGGSRSLANATTFILENQERGVEMQQKAKEKAKKHIWKETEIKTVRVYEDTLDES